MSWLCHCGLVNSGLNEQCAAIQFDRRSEHYQISSNKPDYLQYLVTARECKMSILTEKEKARLEKVREHIKNGTSPYASDSITKINIGEKREVIQRPFVEHVIKPEYKNMTPQEEKFQKLYHHTRLFVSTMTDDKLREHREELSDIIFQAKVSKQAADDEDKERKTKLNGKGKEWILTSVEPDQVSSDAINTVKIRKDRMSKIDRYREELQKNKYLDNATIDAMVRNLERHATTKTLNAVDVTKSKVVDVESKIETKTESVSSEPFDPTKLFGK